MSLIIAGDRSGAGKTTVTLALLSGLIQRGSTQSFKVGPDYIDPMFHGAVTGRPCRNLDPILTSPSYVQSCFHRHSQAVDYSLVEGVMGLFDGVSRPSSNLISAPENLSMPLLPEDCPTDIPEGFSEKSSEKFLGTIADFASTAHVARLLDLPVLLVLDCRSLSGSIAAIVHGFATFDLGVKIAGLILNKVGSDRHAELLTTALEPLGIPIMGILRREVSLEIPDRHLGLVPTAELDGLSELLTELKAIAERCFDWEKLLPLLNNKSKGANHESEVANNEFKGVNNESKGAKPCAPTSWMIRTDSSLPIFDCDSNSPLLKGGQGGSSDNSENPKIRIAVARDRAFSFYYQDNLELLELLGAELVYWSPLKDEKLPPEVRGLYFGGGFPEVFAEELAANESARKAVHKVILGGMPTYAECGGLMYLTRAIKDFQGQTWEMVGILPTEAEMGDRLTLGYRQATALQDGLIVQQGQQVWGHEFHRSIVTPSPTIPLWHTQSLGQIQNQEGWYLPHLPHLHASYLHLHWGSDPEIPRQFLHKAFLHTES